MKLLSEKISIAKIEIYENEVFSKYKVNHHYIFCKSNTKEIVLIRVLHEKMGFIRHL
jgi:plasmid stabilization system protein ParE